MTPISFTVLGLAAPAGSKTPWLPKYKDGSPVMKNGRQVIATMDACKKSKPWKREVAEAARQAYDGELLDCPLSLTLTFYRPRPKGHFGVRGVKPSAPLWPTGRRLAELMRKVQEVKLLCMRYPGPRRTLAENVLKVINA